MYEASAESRNAITEATSSGGAARPIGMAAARARSTAPRSMPRAAAMPSRTTAFIGVSITPGHTALTRTPRFAQAWANVLVMLSTAALLAE